VTFPSTIPAKAYVLVCNKQGEAQMAHIKAKVSAIDPVWSRICDEARGAVRDEPLLGALIHAGLLHHPSLERALAYRFSLKLASGEMSEQLLREIADEAYSSEPDIGAAARADLVAVYDRDPACHRFLQPILFFKGFQALQSYRIAHWLWGQGRRDMAYFVQMRTSEMFGVDIHPAARIGRGVMIDHAHSIVIGETAVVGDNVSMLHSVTLGGTGKEEEDRHPKIGNGVLIGAGAKVLGNIRVGENSRIAAGSVVLADVPCCKTVAGVPARIVGDAGCDQPASEMDQILKNGC
jgi:serine O-acetyltransferase